MDSIAVDGLGTDPGFAPDPPREGFDVIPMWVADIELPDRAHDPAGHHRTGEASRLRVLLPHRRHSHAPSSTGSPRATGSPD